PGIQTTPQNQAKVFNTANGNLVSVSDAEATNLFVTLAVTNGTLTLSSTSGLAFTAGDGTTDATMSFNGPISSINAALNGLLYQPTNGFSGNATLSITTNDNGVSGSG